MIFRYLALAWLVAVTATIAIADAHADSQALIALALSMFCAGMLSRQRP